MLTKFIGIGNLTKDPELRQTPNGNAVCEMRVAFNRTYKDGGGERRQETVYLDVEAWRRLAETCQKHLALGRKVYVEGHLSQDHWDDKQTGKKREKVYITAERILFLDAKNGAAEVSASSDEGAGEAPGDDVAEPAATEAGS